jgi:hypothetical protein
VNISTTKEEAMNRAKKTRARFGVLLAAALGALALLALPGLSAAKDRHDDHAPHRGEKRHDHGHHNGRHHHEAGDTGTIASFDKATGRLTIDLFGNDTVSGLVTSHTKIRCEDEHSPDVSDDRRRGEAEPGDDHGGHGEAEPGDDHGDHGDNSGPGSSSSGPSGHDDNGTGANCTTSDRVVGAVGQEAELEIEHGAATFEEVELAG